MTGKDESRWDIDDVATYLDVPVQTIYQWRKRKYGPPAAKLGKHLRFDPVAVRSWFAEQSKAA
jgi:predicted DNA-binding transcriptional regulator AlpA